MDILNPQALTQHLAARDVDVKSLQARQDTYEDPTGRHHGDRLCPRAGGAKKARRGLHQIETACPCILAALTEPAVRLVTEAEELSGAEELAQERSRDLEHLHELEEELRSMERTTHHEHLQTWAEKTREALEARIRAVRTHHQSSENRERLHQGASVELLQSSAPARLTKEEEEVIASGDPHKVRCVEMWVQEAYCEKLWELVDTKEWESADTESLLAEVLDAVTHESGEKDPAWHAEAEKTSQRLLTAWEKLRKETHEDGTYLVAYHEITRLPYEAEEHAAAFLLHEESSTKILHVPGAVKERLEEARLDAKPHDTARLREDDTESTIEIAAKLYDPRSPALSTLEAALEVARSM